MQMSKVSFEAEKCPAHATPTIFYELSLSAAKAETQAGLGDPAALAKQPRNPFSLRVDGSRKSAKPNAVAATATIAAGLLVAIWASLSLVSQPAAPNAAAALRASTALVTPSHRPLPAVGEMDGEGPESAAPSHRTNGDKLARAEPRPPIRSFLFSGRPAIEPVTAFDADRAVADGVTINASLEADAETEAPMRNLLDAEHVREIQQKLADLGFLHARATGIWGPHSRQALRAFKETRLLPADDVWDAATEFALLDTPLRETASYVGVWAPDVTACSARLNRKGLLLALIDGDGARAGNATCVFRSKKQVGTEWSVVAKCSHARSRWTANVRLAVSGNQLTWSSERGSQTYVRCDQPMMVAQAEK
jgi:hypothetical protein